MASAREPVELKLNEKYDHYDFPLTSDLPKPGHFGNLTQDEIDKLHELRGLLEKEKCTTTLDTLTLLRFLRARKFNVEAAKTMFITFDTWRKGKVGDVKFPNVKNWTYREKADISEYYPQYYHKTDKLGRPIYIEELGKISIKKMKEVVSPDRMLQNLVVEYERVGDDRLPACSRASNSLQETCCTIMDMKGAGMYTAYDAKPFVERAFAISQNYYPERLGIVFVINSPWWLQTLFGIVSAFLDPVTISKVILLGSNFQKELLEVVDAENLPSHITGGTCKCEGGCQMSDVGPWNK